MTILTANELKTKGVSGIDKILQEQEEVIISVRGKPRYVVVSLQQYEFLRERELEAAWYQVRAEVAEGDFRREGAQEHMTRVEAELDDAL